MMGCSGSASHFFVTVTVKVAVETPGPRQRIQHAKLTLVEMAGRLADALSFAHTHTHTHTHFRVAVLVLVEMSRRWWFWLK